MTVISDTKGIKSINNSNSTLLTTGLNIRQNTVKTGTRSVITLDDNASSIDGEYNNLVIEILSGVGQGQTCLITNYIGSTKTASVICNIAPDSSSTYVIHKHSGKCQIQNQINTFKTVKLSPYASSYNNFYTGAYIRFVGGAGKGSLVLIVSYDGSTKIATLNNEIHELIDSTSLYVIYGEGGIATGGDSTHIVLQNAGYHCENDNYYNGLIIDIINGLGMGQTRTIINYDGYSGIVTVSPWTIVPDNTSQYIIYGGWTGIYESVLEYTQLTYTMSLTNGKECIIDMQLSLNANGSNKKSKIIQSTLSSPSTVHTLVITSEYFRVRVIGLGTSLTGEIQVIYHNAKNKSLSSLIKEGINDYNDCDLARSVITGRNTNGKYNNISIDSGNRLLVNVAQPTASFGELLTVQSEPVVQISHVYDINQVTPFFDNGTIVEMVTEGNGYTAQVQNIFLTGGSEFSNNGPGNYFNIYSSNGIPYCIWFDVNNGNINPNGGGTNIEINISATDTPSQVASILGVIMQNHANFNANVTNNIVTITNATVGKVRSINPATMPTSSGSIVSHDFEHSMIQLKPSAGIGSYAGFKSNRTLIYRAGQGVSSRFTAVFGPPEEGNVQLAGIGNQVSGLFFGYNGTSFGVMHRSSGQPSIYKLLISSGAKRNGTIVITLDGIDFIIPLTIGSSEHNAFEIGQNSLFQRGNWVTEVYDSTIYFLSTTATGIRDKTYLFNATGLLGISSINGIQLEKEGSAVVNSWITQNDWNVERFNGQGNLAMILNPLNGNTYEIVFQWLGFGQILFLLEDNDTGTFFPVHKIRYVNEHLFPSMSLPFMNVLFSSYNTTSVQSVMLKNASGTIATQGIVRKFDNIFSTSTSCDISETVETAFLSLRNKRIYKKKINNTEIEFKILRFTNDENNSVTIRIYLGGIIGETNYKTVDRENSSMTQDTYNKIVPIGGRTLLSVPISGKSSVDFEINKLSITLHNNEFITLTIQSNSNNKILLTTSLVWQEDR